LTGNPDGFFDFIDGVTVLVDRGKIIFPVIEPFGNHLRSKIIDSRIADKYVFRSYMIPPRQWHVKWPRKTNSK
jgi:cell surface protein SprA